MEVSLDKGFPEAILFCLDGRILHQDPDYESFLFEGNMCHKYGYFVKDHLKTQAPWAYQADLQSAQQSSDQNQFKTVTFKFQWIPIQGSASSGRNDNLKDRDSYIPRNHPGNHSSHHQEHSEQITVDTRIPIVAKEPQLPPREEEQRIIQAEPQVAAKKDSNE